MKLLRFLKTLAIACLAMLPASGLADDLSAGFTLWNTHEGIPKGPVKYASQPWWELLKHTINEAERLSLEMGIFNGAGWSSTGAAFVTPDKAMQEVAWAEAKVKGPGKVQMKLAIPKAALGIERDTKRDPIINRRCYMPREHRMELTNQ